VELDVFVAEPAAEQDAQLESAGQPQMLTSPEWIVPQGRQGGHRIHLAEAGRFARAGELVT
jgi:hypothetical protein